MAMLVDASRFPVGLDIDYESLDPELQEELVQFYKFIQDNELKKNRAMKKANSAKLPA